MERTAFVVSLTLICSPVWAENGDLPGSGSETDPYLIEDLADFDAYCADSAFWATGVYTKLSTDLDLSSKPDYTQAPIAPDTDSSSPAGDGFQGTAYAGHFDGDGHMISSLAISNSAADYIGLFGSIHSSGVIQNLAIVGGSCTARSTVGALCGNSEGAIMSCQVMGGACTADRWLNEANAGGLCGRNAGNVTSCQATSRVETFSGIHTGGLCGLNLGIIQDSYATGNVSGLEVVGGLCGSNSGTIKNCRATGPATGTHMVGGLCGRNSSSIGSCLISQCFATGAVDCDEIGGGLCGFNNDTIADCFATGRVDCWYEAGGGFCGENSGPITNCFSIGYVRQNDAATGGLCGGFQTGPTTASFWDMETSRFTISVGGIGKTTAEMQTQATFTDAGWDFVIETDNGTDDIWIMDAYPALAWHADTDDDTLLDRVERQIIDANGSDDVTGLQHVHTTSDFDGDYFSDAYEILNGWLPLDPSDGDALSAEMIAVIQANADHQGSAGLYPESAIRNVYVGTPLVEVDPHANQVTLDFELHWTDGLLAANWQPLDTLQSTDTYNGDTRFYRLFFDGLTSANGPPIVLEAEDGLVQAPFTALHGVVWQEVQTTNPSDGGLIQIDFEVTTPGTYTVCALVNAPNGGANSLFVNIDADPVAPEMIWNILPFTRGFNERFVTWAGDGGPEGTPKRFDLSAGTHTLFIRGREINTRIDRIVIE